MDPRIDMATHLLLMQLVQERTGWRRWLLGRWTIPHRRLRETAATILAAKRAERTKPRDAWVGEVLDDMEKMRAAHRGPGW